MLRLCNPRLPWLNARWVQQYANNSETTVSLMRVKAGQRLSLQSHTGQAELWIVLDDGAAVQINDQVFHPKAGDKLWIPAEARHRLLSTGPEARVLEVAFGNRWILRDSMTITPDPLKGTARD